jgi:hypothetical protein
MIPGADQREGPMYLAERPFSEVPMKVPRLGRTLELVVLCGLGSGRFCLPQFVQSGLKSVSEFFRRTGTPIVQKVNGRLRTCHVVVNRNHA